MATQPAAMDAPPDPADDQTDAPAPEDAGDDTASGPTVLCTVMSNGDGTYTLQAGDEPETGDTGEGAGGEMDGGDSASAGTTYDTPGALLKGVLDIVQADMDQNGGEGSADENFKSGYDGGSSASPSKPAMTQKY